MNTDKYGFYKGGRWSQEKGMMADNSINLLRKVLAETENGGRVRTTTRMEIKNVVDYADHLQQPFTLDAYKRLHPEEFTKSCDRCKSSNLEHDGTCRDC